jgi:hypothetical protein
MQGEDAKREEGAQSAGQTWSIPVTEWTGTGSSLKIYESAGLTLFPEQDLSQSQTGRIRNCKTDLVYLPTKILFVF